MKNLSFTKKIVSYFFLSLLVLLGIFVLIHRNTQSFIISASGVEHTNEVLLQNAAILDDVQALSNNTRGYLLSGNQEFLSPYYKSEASLPTSIIKLKKITADNPGQQRRINLLGTLITSYVDFVKKLIDTRRQEGFDAANRLFVTLIGKHLLDKIQVSIVEIEQAERTLLAERKIENERSRNKSQELLVILEALIVSLLVIGFRVIYNNTLKRNKAELEIRRSNNFISSIINGSNNPISVRDLSGNYTLANDQFLRYVDLPRAEVEHKPYSAVFSPEICKRIKAVEDEVINTKAAQLKEFKMSLKDGIHWYTSSTFPLLDENNNINAICSVLTDITVNKKSEESLHKSNHQLQTLLNRMQELLNTSLDVICIFDEEGRIIQISSACESLLGYKPEELVGQRYIDFVHPDDVPKTTTMAEKIMSGATVNDFENRYRKKDESYVPVIWVAIWSEEEKMMYGIAKDRTKRQQTLEELKYSEQNLANAQKIAMLGSWEVDFQRRVVSGSEQFYEIIGRTKEELGTPIDNYYNIAHPEDKSVLTIAFEKAVREKGIWDVEFRIVQGSNKVIYVQAKAQIEFDKRKQPKWFKGTLQDITQRKKLEQERELVIQELTKSNNDLKQFSFITSHNFRAPLCNMLGILDLMDDNNLDTNNKELLNMLKTSSLQLNKTIDDLANILLIKNSGSDEISNISLAGVYKKIEKVFSHALIEANGYVETDFELPYVNFNPVYLESIFVNLVSNSIKYRSRDKSLRISISTKANNEGSTVLTYSDNGMGIDLKRHREKIFGLYQRFHENRSGDGLGLFMIKSQINALNGRIEVESEVGKGTSFIITFKNLVAPPVYGVMEPEVVNIKAIG